MTLGAKTLTASYAGDANFAGSVSGGESHQVNPASTTTTLVSSQNPSIVDDTVTFTATVSPAPAGGTVAFKEDGAAIAGCGAQPLTAGQATCATAALTAQVHRITAAYSGDANYDLSSSDALYQGVHARPAVGAGAGHTCGLKADGTLACWGDNGYGQTAVPSNPNWVQVSASWYHTCGLQADGTLACWGDNTYGQTAVPSNPNWVQVSVGLYHTCGLQADGTLACWGSNSDGQTDVPSPNANWVQVSAGLYHTCGLKADGMLVCWGWNYDGQTTVPSNPNWVQVSVGGYHTCGLQADGTLACWGYNGSGRATVPSPNANWVQVSAGLPYTCGLKADGTLACWGDNTYGQAAVPSPNAKWVQVSVGRYHTCGLQADGTLRCWGDNGYGQAPVITLAPATLPNAMFGVAYAQNLSAGGGSATPYTFSALSGAVPPGLALNADGTWSGMPTAAGAFNFTAEAKDANNIAGTRDYALTVDRASTSTTITSATPDPSELGQPVTVQFSVTSAAARRRATSRSAMGRSRAPRPLPRVNAR